MFKEHFGTIRQINFETESDYYLFLGYLTKNDGSTRIVWEKNKQSGAYEDEGRIQFFAELPNEISENLKLTAGVGTILHRVNCNEFTKNIVEDHNFKYDNNQNVDQIRATIPDEYIEDFERGLEL